MSRLVSNSGPTRYYLVSVIHNTKAEQRATVVPSCYVFTSTAGEIAMPDTEDAARQCWHYYERLSVMLGALVVLAMVPTRLFAGFSKLGVTTEKLRAFS